MPPSTPTAVTAAGRPATDPAGPTGRLATWVAKTTLNDVPASVRDRAKHLVLDGVAWTLWRRHHQYQAPANPPALARLRRRGASTLTTITTVNDGG